MEWPGSRPSLHDRAGRIPPAGGPGVMRSQAVSRSMAAGDFTQGRPRHQGLGQTPLRRGTDLRPAPPVQTSRCPGGTPNRTPRRLRLGGLRPHLLAVAEEAPIMIVLRALRRTGGWNSSGTGAAGGAASRGARGSCSPRALPRYRPGCESLPSCGRRSGAGTYAGPDAIQQWRPDPSLHAAGLGIVARSTNRTSCNYAEALGPTQIRPLCD